MSIPRYVHPSKLRCQACDARTPPRHSVKLLLCARRAAGLSCVTYCRACDGNLAAVGGAREWGLP